MTTRSIIVLPTAPFAFEHTAENQPYFRKGQSPSTDVYQRLLDLDGKLVLASVQFNGELGEPELNVVLRGEELTGADLEIAESQVKRLLGTEQDIRPFYQFADDDPVMANLVKAFYGMHQTLALSVFETIGQAILGQQLSASVARVIRALLVETYGPSLEVDGETHYAFPRAESIASVSVEELRGLKLSHRKAEYLHSLALAELETPGGLDRVNELDDEEVVRKVTSLRGVGMWSAQWVLSRALGRPDAFPVGDLALKRIVSQLYFGGEALTDTELGEFSWRWSPYRSLATSYLFAALRTGRGQDVTAQGQRVYTPG
jgi:DNA-3-methyladenine glycosylase II